MFALPLPLLNFLEMGKSILKTQPPCPDRLHPSHPISCIALLHTLITYYSHFTPMFHILTHHLILTHTSHIISFTYSLYILSIMYRITYVSCRCIASHSLLPLFSTLHHYMTDCHDTTTYDIMTYT